MRLVIALILVMSASFAAAEDRNYYVGIGGGGTNFESDSFDVLLPSDPAQPLSSVIDDSDGNFRLYGGYRFSPNLAVEVLYSDIGEWELIDDTNGFEATYEASSVDLAAVGLLPLADGRFDLFARAGIAFWSLDTELASLGGLTGEPAFAVNPESSGQDLFWAVGFNINAFADKRWTLRSELTSYEVGDFEELAQFAFNFQYRF